MGSRWIAGTFALSILAPLVEALFPETILVRGSMAALALLPWLLVASLPRGLASHGASCWREGLFFGALALPPLGLAVGIDLARGADGRALLLVVAPAWVVLVLWAVAAERASRFATTRSLYASLWLVLFPGIAALRLALSWVPRGAQEPRGALARSLGLDPLIWCHRWGQVGGLEATGLVEALWALSGTVLVLGVVWEVGRRRDRGIAT